MHGFQFLDFLSHLYRHPNSGVFDSDNLPDGRSYRDVFQESFPREIARRKPTWTEERNRQEDGPAEITIRFGIVVG